MSTEINFTSKETVFIGRIMKPFNTLTSQNPILYYEFLEKVMNGQLKGNWIKTPDAVALIEAILFKLAMKRADEEIEKLLTNPNYGEVAIENTKAASYGRVKNISNKHQAIIDMLKKYPDMSRRDLAQMMCIPINRITPRVCELMELNLVHVSGTKWDATTERQVETLKVA